MAASDQIYVPGACNIGGKEVTKRRLFGWISFVAALSLWAVLAALHIAAAWRVVVFIPAMLAALGFLQSRRRFCVMHGLSGTFKLGSAPANSGIVDQVDFRRQDRRAALAIIGLALLIGVVAALAAYNLPTP
jgi:hypothetical protein